MKRSGTVLWLLSLACALGAACNGETTHSEGSETNWLGYCATSEDCGQGQCLCGVCSDECSEAGGCSDDTLVCAVSESPAHDELCAGSVAAPAGVCLLACDATNCPPGNRCEDGACMPTPTPPACSDDTSCSLANAGAACVAGRCAIISCNRDFDNCNDLDADGCEANFATDTMNCDDCGNDCNADRPANTERMLCVMRLCEIERCAPGFQDCNDDREDGCEVEGVCGP